MLRHKGSFIDAPRNPTILDEGPQTTICLFTDPYDRVKTGTPSPENSCGCKSLYEMALAHRKDCDN
jgi:hypothetical protein